jgi:O-antigen/teichoic acid export membrane protein
MGFSVFIVPWLISHFTPNLAAVIGGLWIVRLFSALALAWVSRDCFQVEGGSVLLPRARDILRFGGWLTVTNIIGPMLTYFDRFAISALLSLTAVTYYTVSFDVLSRLPAIPVAIMGVFFPAFAQIHAKTDGGDTDLLRTTQVSIRILCVLWVPMMLTIGLFGEKLLTLWLGVDMAVASAQVWHWLAIGVLVNGFAHVPYALLQSAGRTDITAKFHLLELVPYFIFLWWALEIYGITGAAIAWTVRICIDTVALFWAAGRVSPVVFYLSRNTLVLLTLLIIVYFCIGEYIAQSIQDPVVTGAVCILLLFMTAWIIYQMRQLRLDARESR